MNKLSISVLAAVLLAVGGAGCKKHHTDPNAPMVALLRANCTSPFKGHGNTSDIYLPTAFTPNGDGLNDSYNMACYGLVPGYFSSLSVNIFDTTGVLVYQSSGTALLAWDGIDQNTHSISTKYKYYVSIKYTTSGNVSDSGYTYLYLLPGRTCVNAVWADTARYRFPNQFDLLTGYKPEWGSNESYCY